MAWAFSELLGTGETTAASSLAITVSGSHAAGNPIVVCWVSTGGNVNSIADEGGINTYFLLHRQSTIGKAAEIWVSSGAHAAGATITLTLNSAVNSVAGATEWTGGVAVEDSEGGASGTTGAPNVSWTIVGADTLSIAASVQLLLALDINDPVGWTNATDTKHSTLNIWLHMSYNIGIAAGAATYTCTFSVAGGSWTTSVDSLSLSAPAAANNLDNLSMCMAQ